MDCNICLNTYTKKLRQKIVCQYCPEHACKECQQQYLLKTYEDPHCFSCKRGWSSDFMVQNFPLSFRNNTLRFHRRTILFEREKSLLPSMQIFVEAKRNIDRVNLAYNEAKAEFVKKDQNLKKLLDEVRNYERDVWNDLSDKKLKGQITNVNKLEYKNAKLIWKLLSENRLKYYNTEYTQAKNHIGEVYDELIYWQNMYLNGTGSAERHRREFMMCCPAEKCRGFLSTSYKCGICDKYTCSECLEVLGLVHETTLEAMKEAHKCKADNIESAKLIKKETRPCPKCGARIFKIDGCDQMYCTVEGCNTAFSWNTGHIVTGRIHNPHYYEWLRRNGGDAPREMGDIPCGGVPAIRTFTRNIIQYTMLSTDEKNYVLEIHRNILDIEFRLPAFPAQQGALMNKEHNVNYLMNKITEDEWKRKLELTEAHFNRKKEIGQLLQTFVTGAADILQGISVAIEDSSKTLKDVTVYIQTISIPTLENLRNYTNDSFKMMSKSRRMAVPQIGEKYGWRGLVALYKSEGSKKPEEPEEPVEENTISTV